MADARDELRHRVVGPDPVRLTEAEVRYLSSRRLGRLATVDGEGAPQNNPVSFHYDGGSGTVDIAGRAMGATRKFRNVATNPRVSLVVDDVVSFDPWRVRCVEIRGWAEALPRRDPPIPGSSGEVIRIHPTMVISFGLEGEG